MGLALIVLRKELLDAWRDRRSLLTTVMYGAWGPLVMALALVAIARDRDPDAPLALALDGRARASSLAAFLEEQQVTLSDAPADPRSAVRARAVPAVLIVDAAFAQQFSDAREARVTLVFNGAWTASNTHARRVRGLLEQYGRRVSDMRLVVRGLAPSIAAPLRVEEQDIATPADRAAVALATLPIFLLVAAFIGGMNVAADASAGERERRSLEALLITPAPASALVIGKWAAAAIVNLGTVALTLAVSATVLRHARVQAIDLPLGLSPAEALHILLALVPLAALAPAVQMFLAMFASTYKEAHGQLSILLFVPMLPGFLLAFGTLEPQRWMRVTPVVGQHLQIADSLRGAPAVSAEVQALAATTIVATGIALAVTAWCLGDERIVRGRV